MAPKPAFTEASNVAVHPAAARLDAAAEAAHLRSLIEKQPSCLMRVGTDGTLLALSDAALSLLGARELAQVLDTNLTELLPGEAAGVWTDFVARVANGGSASAEGEMTDLSGVRRSVLLLGVALPDHPDGLESLLVTVRDVSAARRLESSLQEQEGLRQSNEELRAKLASALADRQRFEVAAADQLELQAALDAAAGEAQQLRAKLEEATTERRQLTAALEEANAAREELQAALTAAAAQRKQLAAATADRHRLRAAVDEAAARREELQATVEATTAQIQQLERAAAERQRLRAALDEAIAGRQQIAQAFEQMVADRDRLEADARERESKRQRMFSELVSGRIKAEEKLAEARADLERVRTALTTAMEAASATRSALAKDVEK